MNGLNTDRGPPQWRAAIELDTLAAAWGLSPPEMAALIGVTDDIVAGWRRSEGVGWTGDTAARAAELGRLHELLWITESYAAWAPWWRRRWQQDSALYGQSPIEAALADAPSALRRLVNHLAALAQPTYE